MNEDVKAYLIRVTTPEQQEGLMAKRAEARAFLREQGL